MLWSLICQLTSDNTTEPRDPRFLSAPVGFIRLLSASLGSSRLLPASLGSSPAHHQRQRATALRSPIPFTPVPAATFHSGWKRDPRLLTTPVSFSRFLSASLGSSRLLPASLGSSRLLSAPLGSSQLLPIPLCSSGLLSAPLGFSRLLSAPPGFSRLLSSSSAASASYGAPLPKTSHTVPAATCLSDWKQDPRLLGYSSAATIDPSRLSACHKTPAPGFSETGPRTRQEWRRMLMGLFQADNLQPVHFGVLVMFLRLPPGRALSRQLYDCNLPC